ncbi:MAG: RNA-binding protein [Gammaproteobacteria bacterium]|nr:MAG: RNA-binding protein [Gammaproteobacteria bacterium]
MKKANQHVRLDKWLWAARFFKTRSLATEAVKGGKVHVNGLRVKPGKVAEIGQLITINKHPQRFEVEVLAISNKRQAFSIAKNLYKETDDSVAHREKEALMRKLANQSVSQTAKGRPTKRNRRQLVRFTRK